jgi:hypothetical protein
LWQRRSCTLMGCLYKVLNTHHGWNLNSKKVMVDETTHRFRAFVHGLYQMVPWYQGTILPPYWYSPSHDCLPRPSNWHCANS